jgi:glycosyltransferase involved in cell wall biosynthesis
LKTYLNAQVSNEKIMNQDNSVNKKTVVFFVRHFTERGTEVALYDYAHYNEEILDNKSIIVCFTLEAQKRHVQNNDRRSYDKFRNRFDLIEIEEMIEMKDIISKYKVDFFYTIVSGEVEPWYQYSNSELWQNCKTIKHCVFNTSFPDADFNITVSHSLNKNLKTNLTVIPHIVVLPDIKEDLREDLKIPKDALVFGRVGAYETFNVYNLIEVISEFCKIYENMYFIFLGTMPFINHHRVIFLETNVDQIYKTKFINTCDAMVHGSHWGETFGMSVAEFSIKNKPIITTYSIENSNNEHLYYLKNKAIIFTNSPSLRYILQNFKEIVKNKNISDWNAYHEISPSSVMKQFAKIFGQETI